MFIVVDTETGGVDTSKSLLQLYAAIVDEKTLETKAEINLLIKPDNKEYHVTAEAMNINRINLIEHEKNAKYERDAKELFLQFLNDNRTIGEKLTVVGWNVGFDLKFIHSKLIPQDVWEQYVSYRIYDLQPVGQFLKETGKLPSNLSSLVSYSKHFGIDVTKAHDARADVVMTKEVLRNFRKVLQ
jgi:DNA polymerase III epsilon subunit-like protein